MSNELGKFLKYLRGNKSLRKYSEYLDISHAYLDNLEKGDPRTGKEITPSIDVLQKLSNKTGYSVDELLQLISGKPYMDVINYHPIYMETGNVFESNYIPTDEEINEIFSNEEKNRTSTINSVKYEIKKLPQSEMIDEHKNTLINMVDYYSYLSKNNESNDNNNK